MLFTINPKILRSLTALQSIMQNKIKTLGFKFQQKINLAPRNQTTVHYKTVQNRAWALHKKIKLSN